MLKKSKPTTFRVFGGLGNQLFIYAAGCYFEKQTGRKVRFSFNKPDFFGTKHKSDLRNLGIVANFDENIFKKLIHFINYLVDKRFGFDFYRNKYASEVIGYDKDLLNAQTSKWVEGYFQTYKYVVDTEIHKNLINLDVFQSSQKFCEILNEVINEECIAMHVRRGDYVQFKNYIGSLNDEYFNNALKYLLENYPENSFKKLFVFTDEIDKSLFVDFPSSYGLDISYVMSNDLTDEESLGLMSQFSWIVISNSSFSWWAAYLGNQEKIVIAPQKWYRGTKDPEDLVPDNWVRTPSIWTD